MDYKFQLLLNSNAFTKEEIKEVMAKSPGQYKTITQFVELAVLELLKKERKGGRVI